MTRLRASRRRDQLLASARQWSRLALVSIALVWISGCALQTTKTDERWGTELASVRKITFTGNEHFRAGTLLTVMATQPRPFWQPWKRGDPYDRGTLEADLLRLRKFYFDRGYLRTSADIGKAQENPADNSVSIEIIIDEGSLTRVKSVQIAGTLPPGLSTKRRLLDDLPLRPTNPLNKEDFDQSRATLVLKMQNAGYARATVVPQTIADTHTHEANVTFTLHPGDLTPFGRITLSGQEQVPEYVLRRQLTVEAGAEYSLTALQDSEGSLYSLPIARAVTTRALNLEAPTGPVDIDFQIIEHKPRTGELSIGASSLESFRYQAKWTHRNLLGKAERFSMQARVSGIQQGLEAELFQPYFFSRRNSLTHRLFALNNQNIDTDPFGIMESLFDIVDPYPAYDFVTFGGQSLLKRDFTKLLTGLVGLELSANRFFNIDPSADPATLAGAEDNILFIQSAGLEWNSRNDDLNPARGALLRGAIEHSNAAVLSDVSFVKMLVEGRYYWPLRGQNVFAGRIKLGGIEPYGDSTSVPSNVRFFAGGVGSVRGFANNRLGPLDTSGNPIGGSSLIEGSLEWRFPIVRGWGGVVFIDFGNVFPSALTYSLDDLRYTGGVGVRYFTPVGPLRLDVAFVLDSRAEDQTAPLYLSIGQAF